MDAAVLSPPDLERLTWSEICARYPDEYLCLVEVDHEHPRGLAFRTAKVIGHGPTRREAIDQALPHWDRATELTFRFTGRIKYVRPTIILDDERDTILFSRMTSSSSTCI